MDETSTSTAAIDNLVWEDWGPMTCARANGPDCPACEG
jgi:hypothetical protein